MNERVGVIAAGLSFLALALAGCAVDDLEDITGATGHVVFCVQDDNNVNFNGVFVNFGNIEINQVEADDDDVTDITDVGDEDETGGPMETSEATTTDDTNATGDDATATTTATDTATQTETETVTTGATGAETEGTGMEGEQEVRSIQVGDIECSRVEDGAAFDFEDVDVGGQAYGNDRSPDTNDAQTDDDEGRGNDDGPGRANQADDRGRDGETEKETIDVESAEIDLQAFTGNRAALLAEADVPAGTIHNVMLDVEEVRVTTDDGEEKDVEVEINKVHLKGPITVQEDRNTLVVFKVDLERSLVVTGQDEVRFKPVIHIQASAPVTQTIEVRETVTTTETANGTMTANETATADTQTTSATGAPTTETATATQNETVTATASPTATTQP